MPPSFGKDRVSTYQSPATFLDNLAISYKSPIHYPRKAADGGPFIPRLRIGGNLAKAILGPAHRSLTKRPQPLTHIFARSPGAHVDRQQVIKGGMRLSGIRSLQQVRHRAFSFFRFGGHGLHQRLVKTRGVRQRPRIAPGETEISQIVHGHSGHDDLDSLVAERGNGASQSVVLHRVFRIKEGDLNDRDV